MPVVRFYMPATVQAVAMLLFVTAIITAITFISIGLGWDIIDGYFLLDALNPGGTGTGGGTGGYNSGHQHLLALCQTQEVAELNKISYYMHR